MAGYNKQCIGCGELIGYDNRFCPICGRVSPFYDACPSCMAQIKREWQRCPSCGRSLYIACPFCAQKTYVSDKCDNCHAPLTVQCENKLCRSQQFFENQKCTECGKKIKHKGRK